jgi:hypothetical protein
VATEKQEVLLSDRIHHRFVQSVACSRPLRGVAGPYKDPQAGRDAKQSNEETEHAAALPIRRAPVETRLVSSIATSPSTGSLNFSQLARTIFG